MNRHLIDKLADGGELTRQELARLITDDSREIAAYLAERANAAREQIYGRQVFIRGLIEFTNYCRNDCYYCGIRRSNDAVSRYRLTEGQILDCCRQGYDLGFRTFVLQGGEDPYWTDERTCQVVSAIRQSYPDCAITLSMGERSREAIRSSLTPVQTAIYCATRQPIQSITAGFIQLNCPWHTAFPVCRP